MSRYPEFQSQSGLRYCKSLSRNTIFLTVLNISHGFDRILLLFIDQGDIYVCPHCPPELTLEISFSNLEFHLRCHGDMLYKCGHCLYYHWQKRTAEKHVAENHHGVKQYVRDVRLEAERVKIQSQLITVNAGSKYCFLDYF